MSALRANAPAWEPPRPPPPPAFNANTHSWIIPRANPTMFQLLYGIAASLVLNYSQWGDQAPKIRQLLMRGANPFQQTSDGKSVLKLFYKKNRTYFTRLLDMLEGLGWQYRVPVQEIRALGDDEDAVLDKLGEYARMIPVVKKNGSNMNIPKHLVVEEELNSNTNTSSRGGKRVKTRKSKRSKQSTKRHIRH